MLSNAADGQGGSAIALHPQIRANSCHGKLRDPQTSMSSGVTRATATTTATTPDLLAWDLIFQKWRRKFQDVAPLPPGSANFDSFQIALQHLTRQYSRKRVSQYLQKLTPSLEHVRSFSGALNSVAQVQDATNLTWGALQIVIEARTLLGADSPIVLTTAVYLQAFELYRKHLRDDCRRKQYASYHEQGHGPVPACAFAAVPA
jgi:hypothetical protein